MSDAVTVERRELLSELRYGYWFNLACERLLGRIDFVLNLAQLLGGSGAVVAMVQKSPVLSVSSGVLVAACAAFALLLQPAVKCERHRIARVGFLGLESRWSDMSASELRTAITSIRMEAPAGFKLLGEPAYNATLRSMGMDDKQVKLSTAARLLDLIS